MDQPGPTDDALVCADVLGAFGVTPTDVRTRSRPGDDLETALGEALRDSRDRTAFLRQVICRSDRGVDVSARYATRTLEDELSAAFGAIGWSLSTTDLGTRLRLEATDPAGRCRETTVAYPESPLGMDNLPAVLSVVNRTLLAGVDARFVLLSSGRDRWRAALVETDELERVRERYGECVSAFDRPLLPEHGPSAYVPDSETDGDTSDPWPAWALEEGTERTGGQLEREAGTESLVEEAEPTLERAAGPEFAEEAAPTVADKPEPSRSPGTTARAGSRATSEASTASRDGFELRGWSPRVTRASDETEDDGERSSAGTGRGQTAEDPTNRTGTESTSSPATARRERSEPEEGFGELSGSVSTTRVSNDSFGAGVEPRDEGDRFLALGAALGSGENVSVRGLLDDDEFLPEIPAVEPDETRIEFEEEFDPGAVSEARATAEQHGFVWVGAGELETVRVENG